MAAPAHQKTPVHHAMVHHAPLHGKVSFGVLDLHKIHHMFYEAAFWRTQAMNSHVTTADAFDHDWGTTTMFGLVSGLGGPAAAAFVHHWGTTQSVDNGQPGKLAHLTVVLGRQMCDRYWEIMHAQGVKAAQGYADAMEVLRCQARDQVLEMYRTTTDHDMALARQAENTRKTFSAILTVAEVSLIVVGCMISLGVGGPAIAYGGMSSVAAGWVSSGVSLGYGVAAEAVKGKPGAWQAIGVKTGTAGMKKGIGLGMTKAGAIAQAHADYHTNGFERVVSTVKRLNAQYGTSKPPTSPAAALQGSLKRVTVMKSSVPVIFAVPSIMTVLQDGMNRWNDD